MQKSKDKSGRMSAQETLELWQAYKQSGDARIRDRLVLTFAPMVKYIVYKKAREIPARCEVEDFISCGLEALIRSTGFFRAKARSLLAMAKQVTDRRCNVTGRQRGCRHLIE